MANFKGTSGNDNLEGTNAGDVFKLGQGGRDTALGKGGIDLFKMGDALDARDSISGGADIDRMELAGDYSAGVVFRAATITGIELLKLKGAFDYDLTMNDGNVAAGETLDIDAAALAAGFALTFDGSAEKDGRFAIEGSQSGDDITGGAGRDQVTLDLGGDDIFHGRGGDDTVKMGGTLRAGDAIDGGGGFDTVKFNAFGLGSDPLVLGAATLTDIDRLIVDFDISLALTTDDATIAPGATMEIDAGAIGSSSTFALDGSAETDGHLDVVSGGGNGGTITGGALSDTILLSAHALEYAVTGGGGADDITCTTGQVRLVYNAVSETSGVDHDVIHGANFDGFLFFDTPVVITDYDGEAAGSVSEGSFDADIAAALNDGFLEADHAALVNANAGDLSGRSYVVVDSNSDGDYTGGIDYIFDITGYTGTLGMSDFT